MPPKSKLPTWMVPIGGFLCRMTWACPMDSPSMPTYLSSAGWMQAPIGQNAWSPVIPADAGFLKGSSILSQWRALGRICITQTGRRIPWWLWILLFPKRWIPSTPTSRPGCMVSPLPCLSVPKVTTTARWTTVAVPISAWPPQEAGPVAALTTPWELTALSGSEDKSTSFHF